MGPDTPRSFQEEPRTVSTAARSSWAAHGCRSQPPTPKAQRFSLKHQLDTHHRVHTGEKPFDLRLCGQRSRDYSAMIKHLRTHGGATPYQCTACLELCSSLAAMQKQLKNHTLQDFPPDWTISSTYLYTYSEGKKYLIPC
ncbi:zinc finger and BTB domain-containing protein 16-A-like [Coregonus clupeaformis]|uniref:zinc finger and BTB domain-containing protein 16-A-like n=1 Tax=Coregonus clupeaformis TaxID=59861 RepID=UPI001E1C7918|nr:zinc finger and BTB domain-containing protein 16-A-like [Coregonus clupeaformis]